MQLIEKLDNRSANIGVFGMGYVGVPLAIAYIEAGFNVVGFDIDDGKVESLNEGKCYLDHLPSSQTEKLSSPKFRATSDFSESESMDALIICVPTPLTENRDPDLSFIRATILSIEPYLRSGQVISLESTTYPGTTEELVIPAFESRRLKVGEDVFVVYSPEREDPGNLDFTTRSIPKVCGGHTTECLRIGEALYKNVVNSVVPVSSLRAAELTKLLENIHRAVNIGLVNEIKIVADKMDIDIHEVIMAASTKPFGFVPYYPGPGLGGHCIPIDPFYLTWKARQYGVHTRFIELAGEINSAMPDYVVGKVVVALNQAEKAVKGSQILVLGIAYKKNVGDMRESPSVVIMEKLRALGAKLEYCDPHVPVFPRMRNHEFNLSSVSLDDINFATYDCVVIATDHDVFDYEKVAAYAKLIVDCRGRLLNGLKNVIKA